MATTTDVAYLDGEFEVPESRPSTIQEIVDIIGESAVVEEAVDNLYYRNKYPRVYKKVAQALTDRHGHVRAEKERKMVGKEGSKTEKIIYVSDMDHIRAFLAASEETNRPVLEGLFNEFGPSEPLYVKGERTGGGGKVSQQALDTANGWFADGVEVAEDMVSKIEGMVPGFKAGRDADGNLTIESAARAIQALQRHLTKQAAKQAGDLLKSR